MESIELAKKYQNIVCKELAEKLPNAPSVGISPSQDGYFLIVYLEKEDSWAATTIKCLENKHKIPIETKVVGKLKIF